MSPLSPPFPLPPRRSLILPCASAGQARTYLLAQRPSTYPQHGNTPSPWIWTSMMRRRCRLSGERSVEMWRRWEEVGIARVQGAERRRGRLCWTVMRMIDGAGVSVRLVSGTPEWGVERRECGRRDGADYSVLYDSKCILLSIHVYPTVFRDLAHRAHSRRIKLGAALGSCGS